VTLIMYLWHAMWLCRAAGCYSAVGSLKHGDNLRLLACMHDWDQQLRRPSLSRQPPILSVNHPLTVSTSVVKKLMRSRSAQRRMGGWHSGATSPTELDTKGGGKGEGHHG
jgi:hypothetical protein